MVPEEFVSRKAVWKFVVAVSLVSPSAQRTRNSRAASEPPAGKAHSVRLLKLSVRNRPVRFTLLLPRLKSSIHGSRSLKLSMMPFVLKTSSSFSQSGGNGGSVARTEFVAPGVGAAAAQFAARVRSSVGSMTWSDDPKPSAFVGHGALSP